MTEKNQILEVVLRCKGEDSLPLKDLKDFQGNLKDLSQEKYQQFKQRLLKNGFAMPILVWKNEGKTYILDGHQRAKTLFLMQEEGIIVPDKIPVVYIEADNRKQAKELVIEYNKKYATIDKKGFDEFMLDADLTLDDIGDFDFDFSFDIEDEPDDDINEKEVDEDLETTHECPKCKYKW